MGATMELTRAHALLKNASTTDNAHWFQDVYVNAGFNDTDDLTDYVQHILYDANAWVNGFPAKVVALNTFKKPKTALMVLLNLEEAVGALGQDVATSVKDAVDAVFNDKKFMRNIVKERKAAPEPEAALDDSNAIDQAQLIRLKHENEALRKALFSLVTEDAGVGDAVKILALSLSTMP